MGFLIAQHNAFGATSREFRRFDTVSNFIPARKRAFRLDVSILCSQRIACTVSPREVKNSRSQSKKVRRYCARAESPNFEMKKFYIEAQLGLFYDFTDPIQGFD